VASTKLTNQNDLSVSQRELIDAAASAAERAYAVYSHFRVGAALRASDGSISLGCNIENVSYGLTNCAERVAIGNAVVNAKSGFSAIAVYSPDCKDEPICPCGACRQVIMELCSPDTEVIMVNSDRSKIRVMSVRQLLPGAFAPSQMGLSASTEASSGDLSGVTGPSEGRRAGSKPKH